MRQQMKHRSVNSRVLGGVVILAVALLLCVEPALANKFETIGGGLSGSSGIKRDWLQKFFLILGGLSLFGAALAVIFPRRNALFLNFANWKQSAIVLCVFAAVFLSMAAFL